MQYYAELFGAAVYDLYFEFGRETAAALASMLETYLGGSDRLLDVCTGTGFLAFELARKSPSRRVLGVDIDEEAIALARHKATRAGLARLEFAVGDASVMPVGEAAFDAVVANQIPSQHERIIDAMVRAARPSGVLGVAVQHPPGPNNQFLSWQYEVDRKLAERWNLPAPATPDRAGTSEDAMRSALKRRGLSVLFVERRESQPADYRTRLMTLMAQPTVLRAVIAHSLRLDSGDNQALMAGCHDFIEVGRRVLDDSFGGRLSYQYLLFGARKDKACPRLGVSAARS
jgi:SAM-dependent methyltransferase